MARQQIRSRARSAAAQTATAANEAPARAGETAALMQDILGRAGAPARAGMQQGVAGSRQFGVLGEQAFESWMRTSNDTLRRVLELNVELAAWGREQLDDSIGAVRSLSQCRSFGDAYGVQVGLMRSSMENSLRHANKVLSLTASVMAAGTSAAQPRDPGD
jgi:hypothetical protein